MYHVHKLPFKNDENELLNLRIPQQTLFLYPPDSSGNRAVGTWAYQSHRSSPYRFYYYCPGLRALKLKEFFYHKHRACESLALNSLVSLRHYFVASKNYIVVYCPKVEQRYSWAVLETSFARSALTKPFPHTTFTRGFSLPLLKAIYLFYNQGTAPKGWGQYLHQGKYFVAHKGVYYNTKLIGTIENGKVVLFPTYRNTFQGDFDDKHRN